MIAPSSQRIAVIRFASIVWIDAFSSAVSFRCFSSKWHRLNHLSSMEMCPVLTSHETTYEISYAVLGRRIWSHTSNLQADSSIGHCSPPQLPLQPSWDLLLMQTFINIYIYTYIYIYIYIYKYIYIYILCVCECVYVYINLYTYIRVHKYIYIYVCVYMCVCIGCESKIRNIQV